MARERTTRKAVEAIGFAEVKLNPVAYQTLARPVVELEVDLIRQLLLKSRGAHIEQMHDLQHQINTLTAVLKEVVGCFEAAEVEGLSAALEGTTDLHLKDLVERRLMYAKLAVEQVLSPEPICT